MLKTRGISRRIASADYWPWCLYRDAGTRPGGRDTFLLRGKKVSKETGTDIGDAVSMELERPVSGVKLPFTDWNSIHWQFELAQELA